MHATYICNVPTENVLQMAKGGRGTGREARSGGVAHEYWY